MRSGHSLSELLVVLAISAIVLGIAAPRFVVWRDGAAVRGAAVQLAQALAAGRRSALLRSEGATVTFDSAAHAAVVLAGNDTVFRTGVASEVAVTFTPSRGTVRYAPGGFGYGAANTSVIVRRGSAADTVFVSRLGRVRLRE